MYFLTEILVKPAIKQSASSGATGKKMAKANNFSKRLWLSNQPIYFVIRFIANHT